MSNVYDQVSRRRFLALGTIAATGAAFPSQSFAAESEGSIDAHVHVWTPDIESYPIDEAFDRDDMRPKSFTPEQLFQHTKPSDVNRIVLIQMSFYNRDNSYMLDMIAKYPGVFSGVGIVDHESDDLVERMTSLAKAGVRGFRLHAHGDEARDWINSEGMNLLWRTAADQGLAVCLLINPSDLPYADALCRKHPETKVVIDHFARVGITGEVVPSELDALCRLARFPTVHVKTSAFYALGKKTPPYKDLLPMIRKLVDAYGANRLMWASDCPYQVQGEHSYKASIELIRNAAENELSEQEKDWLLRGTAQKLFF